MSNKVFFTSAWDNTKNVGKYYNEFMGKLNADEYACITDADVMLELTHDYGTIIYNYIDKYPDAVLTCRTNRIGCPWQKLENIPINNHNIDFHREIARRQRSKCYTVKDGSKETFPFSGFFMLIKKAIWEEVGKFKEDGMLGIDNDFFFKLQQHNKRILVMEGLYVYHQYRIDGSKKHLI